MNNFSEFDLASPISRALAELNYQTPTPIQQQALPPALEGRDILGCAQTGTGKTAAFALPILNMLATQKPRSIRNQPFALILAPTRELVVQIGESLSEYGRHVRYRHSLVYGGVSQKPQVNALRRGLHVVAATPGRLIDLMQQGHISLQQLKFFALDEVDRMLDMGFLPDIKRIVSELPEQRQSLFFSATLPPAIRELTQQLLTDPVRVNVTPKTVTVKKIKQSVTLVEKRRKPAVLREILSGSEVERTVVFTSTKRNANRIEKELRDHGISAVAIHGNKSQNARQKALVAFQKNQYEVLVATDVASRGIDIEGITHVINYDLPQEPECYVHRIGRTGRAGETGTAITFCTSGEMRSLREIENLIRRKLTITRDQGSKHSQDSNEQEGQTRQTKSGEKSNSRRSSESGSNNSRKKDYSFRSRRSKAWSAKRKNTKSQNANSQNAKSHGSSSENSSSQKPGSQAGPRKRRNRRSKPTVQSPVGGKA